ncbi:MAG: hypothetical protein Q9M94_02890 [Candidatus Gracilibacteria bacterium]|nr:hypothetical protein [Candidatus Gracilibacteria bacterium]MDQ7023655.1 hypothetical protein [Candidatus Gracilibacteria bacterium]
MGKKKNKKSTLQKIAKFIVNGKPMSQIVHWTIIGGISGMMFINIVRAGEILETIV